MLNIERLMQISLLVVALISSSLIALSTNSLGLFFVASICAVSGFIFTDVLKWFRIEGWLANVVSIAILFLAMKDFFNIDNSGKLIAVANLLVYLQSVLMFQTKTPRLNWQILVLSLLQIVITTIFSVDFSYSYLLLGYFIAAGTAMVLQSLYADTSDVARRNKLAIAGLQAIGNNVVASGGPESKKNKSRVVPLTLFDAPGYRSKTLLRAMGQLSYWTIASLIFTLVLFLMAPKSSKSLFQPITYKVTATGFNNEVNLNETGVIRNSKNVIFHAKFEDPYSDQVVRFNEVPYFRAMALSTLKIKDGHTNWIAPFDRVESSFYRSLPKSTKTSSRLVKQTITLEQTSNPMIYGVYPIIAAPHTGRKIEFCREISTHVRCHDDEKIALSPYKYEINTLADQRNAPLKGWPYVGVGSRSQASPIKPRSLTHRWLTEMDRERYPVLVAEADRIAAENEAANGSLKDLVDKFTNYFSGNRFKYTLDYRNVPRDKSLDSLEDFFANHRSGHCEMYASALTLMLRSQNIPARVVVGFVGKDYNDLTDSYVVRADHAHAWTEVYFHPDQCSEADFESGVANLSGAWITADPNPIEELTGSGGSVSNPIELARTVWQDVVLGMENTNSRDQDYQSSIIYQRILNMLDSSNTTLTNLKKLPSNRFAQAATAGFLVLILLIRMLFRFFKDRSKQNQRRSHSIFKRFVASAVGLISSDLERWMLNTGGGSTSFYDRLTEILQSYDLVRSPNQTHREFAKTSLSHFADHDDRSFIERVIKETTDKFYQVRFGDQELTQTESEGISSDLASLKQTLAATSPQRLNDGHNF